MTAIQWVVAVMGSLGGGKFLYDIFTARAINRKTLAESGKTSAEGAVVLVTSATEYAAGITRQLEAMNRRFEEYRAEQERKWDERGQLDREQFALFRDHQVWDDQIAGQLRDQGIKVPPPPPLYIQHGKATA